MEKTGGMVWKVGMEKTDKMVHQASQDWLEPTGKTVKTGEMDKTALPDLQDQTAKTDTMDRTEKTAKTEKMGKMERRDCQVLCSAVRLHLIERQHVS